MEVVEVEEEPQLRLVAAAEEVEEQRRCRIAEAAGVVEEEPQKSGEVAAVEERWTAVAEEEVVVDC